MNPILVVPARLGSTRLPRKPLAMIAGAPMIVHVWRRATEVALGPVLVAADDPAIADAVRAAGGEAVLTRPDHPSGTDRIAEALSLVDPGGRHDVVINLQGDLPTVAPEATRAAAALLADEAVDVATPVAIVRDEHEADAAHVVKMVGTPDPQDRRRFRALYFTRVRAPWGDGPLFHHIGLYAWRRPSFERFVRLPASVLEQREKLEQLRALEAGMRVDAVLVDDVPLGVDTPEDLERARAMLARPPATH
ncbi:3-deoxy-manno-octulosonate cytidylyltransferase [Rhizosaccharibacter radicis]|uniref:3-deoxy-manno-octulosonate cytidylyltransferase n=1 Tax=Rhizosaccharibacter radicis TaxID=2782605 RepID=A0ABT1VT60_9PROT|nr:3-deoxy-manno-octulosonate cytidylyltransferase [Acetobacteraceae bacterium KSS12]